MLEVTFITMELGIVPGACIVAIQFVGIVLLYVMIVLSKHTSNGA